MPAHQNKFLAMAIPAPCLGQQQDPTWDPAGSCTVWLFDPRLRWKVAITIIVLANCL